MEYTVEVYKRDGRRKSGERLFKTIDLGDTTIESVDAITAGLESQGYRVELHETYVTKHNLMGGGEFRERYDTPHFCSPSSESYWSM